MSWLHDVHKNEVCVYHWFNKDLIWSSNAFCAFGYLINKAISNNRSLRLSHFILRKLYDFIFACYVRWRKHFKIQIVFLNLFFNSFCVNNKQYQHFVFTIHRIPLKCLKCTVVDFYTLYIRIFYNTSYQSSIC